MTSAGNDIVSLVSVNITRTRQPAFYKKILANFEIEQYREVYSATISFVNYVWLLWSVKEAAYKYLKRFDAGLVFSPTKFIVSELRKPVTAFDEKFNVVQLEGIGFDENTSWSSKVGYDFEMLYSRSLVYSDLLHTIVDRTEHFHKVYWGIKTITDANPEQQSDAVRGFLLNKLKMVRADNEWQIGKSKNELPIILNNNTEFPVSFSHHGLFVAYSFFWDQ